MNLIDHLSENPLQDLKAWIDHATQLGLPEPDAMTLTTVSVDKRPSARLVLCKKVAADGLHFFTNYESRKALELQANPFAAAVFFWPTIAKQVRVEGHVTKLARQVSEDYFRSRPRGSQLGAWVSQQSTEIPNYATLEKIFREKEEEFSGKDVPCPPHWGGFLIAPSMIEFWVGLPSRLHDRVSVSQVGSIPNLRWIKKQIAP